jgi:hypothetical protein
MIIYKLNFYLNKALKGIKKSLDNDKVPFKGSEFARSRSSSDLRKDVRSARIYSPKSLLRGAYYFLLLPKDVPVNYGLSLLPFYKSAVELDNEHKSDLDSIKRNAQNLY